MKKNSKKFYRSMCKIGCIGFGGGSALIPVIEDEVIREQQIDTQDAYDKDVMIASITPGALPVELASSLGRRNFGVPGMLAGAFLMALPGAVLTIVSLTLLSFAQDRILGTVQKLSIGVSAFILCLLLQYILSTLEKCKEESTERIYKAVFVMLVVFALAGGRNIYRFWGIDRSPVFAISTFHILVSVFFFVFAMRGKSRGKLLPVVLLLIMGYYLIHGKAQIIRNPYAVFLIQAAMFGLALKGVYQEFNEDGKKVRREKTVPADFLIWAGILAVCLLTAVIIEKDILSFAGKGILSSLISFGGGDAYLTVAEGLFVDGGQITGEQFYGHIVNVVNIFPGSILSKTLAAIGYYAGRNCNAGWVTTAVFAGIGFLISVAVSCGVYHLVYAFYDKFQIMKVFQMIHRWIRPIVAGLLLNIMMTIINQCVQTAEKLQYSSQNVVVFLAVFCIFDLLLLKKRIKPFFLVICNIVCVFVCLGSSIL